MISQREFAQLLDGPAVDREIDRLTRKRGGWLDVAQILSRRINGTVDWEPLGPAGARLSVIGSRGEAVLFDDRIDPTRIIKLRGREENGFGTAGFGCILVRNERGMVEYGPGSVSQALNRERLSWELLGFGCELETMIGDNVGMLLSQRFIVGNTPTEGEIQAWMIAHGGSPSLRGGTSPSLCVVTPGSVTASALSTRMTRISSAAKPTANSIRSI